MNVVQNLVQENECLKRQIEQLKAENEELKTQLQEARTAANRAKDFSPVGRASLARVLMVARRTCMNVKKLADGWLLSMGNLERKFKRLKDIWLLLTQEDWHLSDIFSPKESPIKSPIKVQHKRRPHRQVFDWNPWVLPKETDDSLENAEDDMPFAWSD